MRGYNLSSKPDGIAFYDVGQLTVDIRDLIRERGAETAMLAGHDWGGSIAWATAMNHPEVVDRLAILNAAHPRKLSQGLHHPGQLRKSWYFFFFDLPDLPETVVRAATGISSGTSCATPTRPTRRRRSTAISRRGRSTGGATGMINYYRSSVRTSPKRAEAALRPITAPTLVIWGQRDRYLGDELAEPDRDDVPNLDRVERLADASHWVDHNGEPSALTRCSLTSSLPPCKPATEQLARRGRGAGPGAVAAAGIAADVVPSRCGRGKARGLRLSGR